MKTWIVVYQEHYLKYLEVNTLEDTVASFQSFCKDIGTISVAFAQPKESEVSYITTKEVPEGTCIRLRTSDKYRLIVQEKLFPRDEPQDKSRRTSSCTIV